MWLEGIDTELGEVALVYLKMYDLVRFGAKAGLVLRVLVMGDHLVRLLAVSGVRIHESSWLFVLGWDN